MEKSARNYYLSGAAIALVSTATIITYAVKKVKQEKASIGILLAGIAGLVYSAKIAAKPDKEAIKKLTVEDLLDEADTDLMQMNISEILGNSADRGKTPEKLRHIEIDEEASIEDFM